MLYSRTQDSQTFSVPTEKQSRGNQSRGTVGLLPFPSTVQMQTTVHPGSKPPWVTASSAAYSHRWDGWKSPKAWDGYRAAFFTICQSDNIPRQYSTAVHPVRTSKRHSSNLRNASLLPQKIVGIPASSNKTHILGWDKWNVKAELGENLLNP